MLNDQTIFSPILSIFISIILSIGITQIGLIVLKNKHIEKILDINPFLVYAAPIIGLYFFLSILYFFFIFKFFNFISVIILNTFLVLLCLSFMVKNFNFVKKIKIKAIKKNFIFFLIIIIFTSYFFISLGPITHADALDYHVKGAFDFLNGKNPFLNILPMHHHLLGAGELLIAAGLAFKSDHLISIIQFFCLFTFLIIFKHCKKFNHIILLAILSSPIIIFFISSSKPQFFAICGSFLIFYLSYFVINKIDEKKIINLILFFSLLVISLNVITKFSFILSSTFLYLLILYYSYKKNNLASFFAISFFIIFLFLISYFSVKPYLINNFFLNFTPSPLPVNIYGYENFDQHLKSIEDGPRIFPYWLVMPKDLGAITNSIGIAFFLLIYLKVDKKNFLIILLVIILFSLYLVFGQATTRFLYEIILWLILLTVISNKINLKNFKLFKLVTIFSSILIIFINFFYISQIYKSFFFTESKSKVMMNNANGYQLFTWVNENIPGEKIISHHRSISLYNGEAYPVFFLNFIDPLNIKSDLYYNFIKKKKIKYLVIYDNRSKELLKYLGNCTGKLVAFRDGVGQHVGRNPYNKVEQKYNAYIYTFKYNLLPDCARNN